MNPQVWWYVARGAGITAWLFLTASIMMGIVLSSGLFPKHRRPAWLLDLHRGLGGLTVAFVGIHIGGLVADNFVHFSLVDVLVPFASSWKPWQVALGVLAFWGLIAVEATSLAMKRLPRSTWRAIHFTSYAVFVLTSLHGTFAGTDATNPLYAWTSIIVTVMLVIAVVIRILGGGRQRPQRPTRLASPVGPARPTRTQLTELPAPRIPGEPLIHH